MYSTRKIVLKNPLIFECTVHEKSLQFVCGFVGFRRRDSGTRRRHGSLRLPDANGNLCDCLLQLFRSVRSAFAFFVFAAELANRLAFLDFVFRLSRLVTEPLASQYEWRVQYRL